MRKKNYFKTRFVKTDYDFALKKISGVEDEKKTKFFDEDGDEAHDEKEGE